jgi:hypothetical protein
MERKHEQHADIRDAPSMPFQQMSLDECQLFVGQRMKINVAETGHPFHHRTMMGAIVTPDPSLEGAIARIQRESGRTEQRFLAFVAKQRNQSWPSALPTRPVIQKGKQ